MSNDLAKSNPAELAVVEQKYGADIFGAVTSSGKWLPRIQLFGSSSNEVKEDKIRAGNHGLVSGKNVTDLGKEFDALSICFRPKAMDIGGDEILTNYVHTSAEFLRMQAQSDVKDSGCMFGPEFLIWVPAEQKWATYFCSNKTSRRAASDLLGLMSKLVDGKPVIVPAPVTIKANLIKTAKYMWHGPVFTKCSTPFGFPTDESLAEEVEKFNNPSESDIVKAPESTNTRAR